ncbi:MAG TPA: PfkB family carbohydrate kinase [Nitrososphaeraceae archaeon]|nr:PfkB family carbohydrate kinase [Nitrososphaeraceae archaeon]
MLTIFGSIALDTTRTSTNIQNRILGGAATFASLSASKYIATNIVGIIGNDFPEQYKKILEQNLNTKGIIIKNNDKSFHYDSSFDPTLTVRTSNKTELNVIANFEPTIPDEFVDSKYVFLANNDPIQNMKIQDLFSNPDFVLCDTIEYWIVNKYEQVLDMIRKVNGITIDITEARLLTKEFNIVKCARKIKELGPELVIIKKGEHGFILFYNDIVFASPAIPVENVIDPTGAGDCFAGGFLGHLSKLGRINENTIKQASIYGNIMGSFAVEDFGVNKILNLSTNDIEERLQFYNKLVTI